jgi:hypothetical protein
MTSAEMGSHRYPGTLIPDPDNAGVGIIKIIKAAPVRARLSYV